MLTKIAIFALLINPLFLYAETIPCVDPRVLILFDASGSLGLKSNPSSNYNAAVSAVLSMVESEGDHIEFGMLVFPSPPSVMHCQTTSMLAVEFSLNAYQKFKQFFDGFDGPNSKSDTPMLQVLNHVQNSKSSTNGIGKLKEPNVPGYVILVTDGSQDCCYDEQFGTGFGWDNEVDCNYGIPYGASNYWIQAEFEENRKELIDMVANIYGQGIPVFVVGFGTKVDPIALDGMAKAGGTAKSSGCGVGTAKGPCYYQADNAKELTEVLSTIAKKVGEEQCNGLDDDCDGDTDENITMECSTICGKGVRVCVNGIFGECSAPQPTDEICNGEDDDCDGYIDEDITEPCFTECGQGIKTCEDGTWGACSTEPKEEVCNGIDDNCDGSVDEGCDCVSGTEESCGSDVGECKKGKRLCLNGKWGDCVGGIGPKPEECNGKDDDCDSVVDGMVRPCSTACGSGIEKCVDGKWVDCTAKKPEDELCNGKDDDCDGEIDEGLSKTCETACGKGEERCKEGIWTDCSAIKPTQEVCDGVDNDCNGIIDDEDATSIPCITDCGKGIRKCMNGMMGECEMIQPSPEECDGLDNDCDGEIDNNAICPNNGKCICHACAFPPNEQGECLDGILTDGLCVIDNCKDGQVCKDGECVDEGDVDNYDPELGTLPENKGAVSSGGCGCRSTEGRGGETLGLLLIAMISFLLMVVMRRVSR